MQHLVCDKVNPGIPGLSIRPIPDPGIGNNGPGLKALHMPYLNVR